MSATASLPPAVPTCGALRGVADAATDLAERQLDAVLAIVVASIGAVQRQRGALALLDARGVRAGTLSGGGLEARLEDAARPVFASRCAGAATLEIGDDDARNPAPNEQRSALQLVLLPLPAPASALREAMVTACKGSAWLRLRIGLGVDEHDTRDLGRGEARTGSRIFAFDHHGLPCTGPLAFERHVSLAFAPPPRIALLGAGPETTALARMARMLGWYVEVVESRERNLSCIDRGSVDRLHAIEPEALPELIAGCHYDAAIVASQDFDLDARNLRCLAAAGIGYVGLLGSPERRDALLVDLGDIVATQLEPRLYAPAGLRLGGDGPESVALSIVAQLQHYLAHDAQA